MTTALAAEKTSYRLEDLSGRAKRRALETLAGWATDHDWWDCIYPDFTEIAGMLGVVVAERDISFTGFWSQGDGASFTGAYYYAKGAAKAIRAYAPRDTELHAIADTLQDVQRRNFYKLSTAIDRIGRYCHEGTMRFTTELDMPGWRSVDDDDAEAIAEAMCDLARWLYGRLEAEYEYLTSEEALTENADVNEYRFDAEGAVI